MRRILIGIQEETHRQLEVSEVEGLIKLGFNISTTIYAGKSGYQNPVRRLYIILKNVITIIQTIRKDRIELLYLNSSFNQNAVIRDFITLLLLRSIEVKKVLKLHGSRAMLLQTRNIFFRFMINKISGWADGFGVLSSEEKGNFIKAGFQSEKLFIMKNIVPSVKHSKSSSFRVSHHLTDDTALALYIGRFIPSKRVIDIIRALAMVKHSGFKIKLLCVGSGPEYKKIRQEVSELDLTESIIFTGFIKEEETKIYYANADMLVFPSLTEGFAMAIFTSVAAGLPVITTQIRAAADYLHEPDNCLWIDQKNPEMIAEKIIYLLRNPDVCNRMSRNNKELSKSFSQKIICQELALIFNQLLKH
jgi:glycosyltransferase involved in cell wall biosynthesis